MVTKAVNTPTDVGRRKERVSSMDLSKITDIARAVAAYWPALLVASTLLLFLPSNVLDILGLDLLVGNYRPWIGGVWLITLSIGAVQWGRSVASWFYSKIRWKLIVRPRLVKKLKDLSPSEKSFLAFYLLANTKVQYADINDGLVGELVSSRIIRRASQLSVYHTRFPFNIQPWAWEELRKNPELVDVSEHQIGSEEQ